MDRKQKRLLIRILVAAALLATAALIPAKGLLRAAVFAVPYLVVGRKVLWKAARNIARGQVFDENFLMCIATIGAFAAGEYLEGVAVMLFYQVGELFEKIAVGRSRRSIAELMDIRPDVANVERGDAIEEVDPEEISVGEMIVIRPGERIPLDGTVADGSSMLDTAALTGESVPRSVRTGDDVVSGCINQSGVLRVRVTKEYGESTVAKILELVENSASRKAESEKFITRFARYYTPVVCVAALLLAVVPPLFVGGWMMWMQRALIFLVVSCPCALVISIPIGFFGGIGGASGCGILIKGGNYLEKLARVDAVVFDKTGTLTEGVFRVASVEPAGVERDTLIEHAALAECFSGHPIARSVLEAYGTEPERRRVTGFEELPGLGVRAVLDGKPILAGNGRLMEQSGVRFPGETKPGTVVHIAVDGVYEGCLVISDVLKPDSAKTVRELRRLGVRRTVMLTGDVPEVGERVAQELGMDEVRCGLLPDQKVEEIERILETSGGRGAVVFVGDGINDAPVLSRADVGIAMGAMGSDAAIEAADVVLMNDRPSRVATAISISRRTLAIVRQNIVFALGVKAVVMILGAVGLANMWAAVFADVGVSVIAILNAMRALRFGKKP